MAGTTGGDPPGKEALPGEERTASGWSRAMASARALLVLLEGPLVATLVPLLAAVMLVHHLLLWRGAALRKGLSWEAFLNHLDASWYSRIVTEGYSDQAFAYFPLYPLLVRGLGALSLEGHPSLVGAALSTALFTGFVLAVASLAKDAALREAGLIPATTAGWLFFLYSPASYVFHSHHTESLFLALTFGAFVLLARGRWLPAAAIAGLAGLTRSQGALAAVAVGVGAAMLPGSRVTRLRRFATCGAISGAISALYPLYSYLEGGDALAFIHAKRFWTHAHGLDDALRTLWLGNPWQNTSETAIWGLITFWAMALSIPLLVGRNLPVALYTALSLSAVLAQGELAGALRYSTVLFPSLFVIGDTCEGARRPLRMSLLAVLVFVNVKVAWRYCRGSWAY